MGFFSFLFRRPIFIEDSVFGQLRREYADRHTGQAWFVTEELFFAPTGKLIECYIDASESGPTLAQQLFYRYIERDYAALVIRLIPIIENEFQNWQPGLCIGDFASEFWLTSISIPIVDGQTQPIRWDWSFETVHDANHMLTFYMSGEDVLPGMQMDG